MEIMIKKLLLFENYDNVYDPGEMQSWPNPMSYKDINDGVEDPE